ncbi:hypothetical protein [Streptomyces sp. ML-6]|uniref:hypothetical protein n=1 Tax=Streptomyces sp. ML-6 TaxID=2982693 RepID=UPI0024C03561|nr:hypothetical protein [Streptomyces sp. ML-6]MDK0519910.1 hypothetical protein [Streptomyces sp. ML-6]
MYAPGHPPTPPRRVPSRAWIVSMRVLFTVLPVCSLGLLLWTPLLRLAIVRRRALDWWLTGAGFVFVCVLLPIIGREGNDEPTTTDGILITLLMLVMAGAITHYYVGDIQYYDRLTKQHLVGGYAAPGYAYATTVPAGTPGPALAPHPVQSPPPLAAQQPQPQPQSPPQSQPYGPLRPTGQDPRIHQTPVVQQGPVVQRPPQPQPSPSPTSQPHLQPQRIDQVRAELDELSDYLRKEEGR